MVSSKKSAAPVKCIYCGSTENITKEHILPDWLRHYIPRTHDSFVHSGFRLAGKVEAANVQAVFKKYDFNIGSKKLFRVCKKCNNGWMKNLQDNAIPVLVPLIEGDWRQFGVAQSEAISLWAIMTATNIAMDYETEGIAERDRYALTQCSKPSMNWGVWLGRASGFEGASHSNRVILLPPDPSKRDASELANSETEWVTITTIVLRQLIIHVVHAPAGGIPYARPYGVRLGVFPVHPWDSDYFAWIPIIPAGSAQFEELKWWFYLQLVAMSDGKTPEYRIK